MNEWIYKKKWVYGRENRIRILLFLLKTGHGREDSSHPVFWPCLSVGIDLAFDILTMDPWLWTLIDIDIDNLIFGDTSTRLHLPTRRKGPLEMKLPTKESITRNNWLTMPRFGAEFM
jgi:hypothetical protein